jgi:hypothetical protein
MAVTVVPKVPNYNALSSLFDRLAVENIKLSYFENALEPDDLESAQIKTHEAKAIAQRRIIEALKHNTVELISTAIESRKYELADIDTAYLVETERLGREHVERRAILTNRIDALFGALVINTPMPIKE